MVKLENIIVFIRSLEKGGAEKQAVLLFEYLRKTHNVFLIVLSDKNKTDRVILESKNVIYLSGHLLNKLYCLFDIIKLNKIKIIFNYLPSNNILGIIIGKIAGVEYIYGGIRGAGYKSKAKMILQRILCNHVATAFISNSWEARRTYVQYGFNDEKIVVIHNAIERTFKSEYKFNVFTVLSVGRFVAEKDYETALLAFKNFIKMNNLSSNQVQMVIIGYGKLFNYIKSLITINELNSFVMILNDEELNDFYLKSHVLLHSSIYEGMSNVIMEAMAHGLPIIATDAGDTNYLVKNGINGFLCKIRNKEEIADKLSKIYNDEKLRIEMGNNSKKIIEDEFIVEKQFRAYSKLIKKLI